MVKKNILFVIESLNLGGAEKSMVTLLQNIDYSVYQVDLFLFVKGGIFDRFVPSQVNIVYSHTIKQAPFLKRIWGRIKFWLLRHFFYQQNTDYLFWKAFEGLFEERKNKYDIAIAYSQGFATYYVAEKITATKKYAWVNTDYQKAGYQMHFDKKYYQAFDKIIAVSEAASISIKNALQKVSLKKEVMVIKDMVDDRQIRALANQPVTDCKTSKETIKIVSVGRLVKPKAFDLAVKSCKELIEKGYNIKWFIVGEGQERDELERIISTNKLKNQFILLGQKENPYPYIKQADIYVQTSLFEGLGLTLIEATILQKPIVTTNFPTAATIITHNKTGLICEMNHHAITNSIIRYIDSPELVKTIVENLARSVNTDKALSLKKINELLFESK